MAAGSTRIGRRGRGRMRTGPTRSAAGPRRPQLQLARPRRDRRVGGRRPTGGRGRSRRTDGRGLMGRRRRPLDAAGKGERRLFAVRRLLAAYWRAVRVRARSLDLVAADDSRAVVGERGVGRHRTGQGGVALAGQAVADDLEREEVLALLAQDPAQPLDVVVVELAVARRRALRVDETLALEETDLRDRDVGELLPQEGEHVADGQVRPARLARTITRPRLRGRRA